LVCLFIFANYLITSFQRTYFATVECEEFLAHTKTDIEMLLFVVEFFLDSRQLSNEQSFFFFSDSFYKLQLSNKKVVCVQKAPKSFTKFICVVLIWKALNCIIFFSYVFKRNFPRGFFSSFFCVVEGVGKLRQRKEKVLVESLF
jgi:hypothetical protein